MKLSPNPRPFRLSLGDRGETLAWKYLASQGYTLIEKNYRCKVGEIDIIAKKSGRLAFLEVKTRSDETYGTPEESVHPAKQKKIIRAAQWYLKEKKIYDTSISFDVLAIRWRAGGEPEIKLIEHAFEAGEGRF